MTFYANRPLLAHSRRPRVIECSELQRSPELLYVLGSRYMRFGKRGGAPTFCLSRGAEIAFFAISMRMNLRNAADEPQVLKASCVLKYLPTRCLQETEKEVFMKLLFATVSMICFAYPRFCGRSRGLQRSPNAGRESTFRATGDCSDAEQRLRGKRFDLRRSRSNWRQH